LANYCDMLLRKTPLSKKLTSDEVEAKLRDVLLVLKYVQVFSNLYFLVKYYEVAAFSDSELLKKFYDYYSRLTNLFYRTRTCS